MPQFLGDNPTFLTFFFGELGGMWLEWIKMKLIQWHQNHNKKDKNNAFHQAPMYLLQVFLALVVCFLESQISSAWWFSQWRGFVLFVEQASLRRSIVSTLDMCSKSGKHVEQIVKLEALCETDSLQRLLTRLILDEFLSEAVITPRHIETLEHAVFNIEHKKPQQLRVQQLSKKDVLTFSPLFAFRQ